MRFLKRIGIQVVGKPRYISYEVIFDSADKFSLITLNDDCVVTGRTMLLTHDFSIWHAGVGAGILKADSEQFSLKAPISIGKNAFVGLNVVILPGVTVGDNSIVAAGSIVTKDVPPNTIVAGNPAKFVRTIEEHASKNKEFLDVNIKKIADQEMKN